MFLKSDFLFFFIKILLYQKKYVVVSVKYPIHIPSHNTK